MIDISTLKKGDLVRIDPHLTDGIDYTFGINEEMCELRGQMSRVMRVGTDRHGREYVKLYIDNGEYYWTGDMLYLAVLNKGRKEEI
jgi:hypothetical protein